MANLRFRRLRDIDFDRKATVTVGHNRTVTKVADIHADIYSFRLHGHEVARLLVEHGGARAVLTLKHCGYLTRTTGAAIKDAIRLFGFWGNVSFAKGEFRAGVQREYAGEALEWCSFDAANGFDFEFGGRNQPMRVNAF